MSAKYVQYVDGQLRRVRYSEEPEERFVSQLVEVGTHFDFIKGRMRRKIVVAVA